MDLLKNHEVRYIGKQNHKMVAPLSEWTFYRFVPEKVYLTTEGEISCWMVQPDEVKEDPKVPTRKCYIWNL